MSLACTKHTDCGPTLDRAGIVNLNLYPTRLLEVFVQDATEAGRSGHELCAELAACLEAEIRRRSEAQR